MNREQKAAVVEDIAAQIGDSQAIFAIDYRGISVPQAAELRSKLREADASFRVVKNRLTKLAAESAGRDELKELLQGPTALTFVRGDTATAAKAIVTFDREHEMLTFKGGFMDGLTLDEDGFKSIARLPSRDVLNGQLAGVVASPITGLVRGLNALISGLAIQLGAIAEQGLVSGEAPAAEEAPAEGSDAPAAGPVAEDEGSDAPAAGPVAEDVPPADSPEEASSTPPAEGEAEGEKAPDAQEPAATEGDEDEGSDAPEQTSDEATSDDSNEEEE